jgi:hypothetical protein
VRRDTGLLQGLEQFQLVYIPQDNGKTHMKYEGITWGPSMRGYLSDNKKRIDRAEKSLASLKNQTGQYAREHRMLLEFYHEFDSVIVKHIELADSALEESR